MKKYLLQQQQGRALSHNNNNNNHKNGAYNHLRRQRRTSFWKASLALILVIGLRNVFVNVDDTATNDLTFNDDATAKTFGRVEGGGIGVTSRAFPSLPKAITSNFSLCLEPDNMTFHPPDGGLLQDFTTPQQQQQQQQQQPQGLFYIKLLKTGGSTSASVHLRIATSMAQRRRQYYKNKNNNLSHKQHWEICKSRHFHGLAHGLDQRSRSLSFLWTTLRDPTLRYVSEFFFFRVSRIQELRQRKILEQQATLDDSLKEFLNGKIQKQEYHSLHWLNTATNAGGRILPPRRRQRKKRQPDDNVQNNDNNNIVTMQIANSILQQYDFIAISERMEESLVVLSMILNIPLGDVLHLDSKRSGSYNGDVHSKKCFLILPPTLSPTMVDYLATNAEWQDYIAPEFALYQAANHSLDLTIAALGPKKVHENRIRFRRALQQAQTKCIDKTLFPCTKDGIWREDDEKDKDANPNNNNNIKNVDCLFHDLGCGFPCLDQVAESLGISSL